MQNIRVIDSHTAGEPTRLVLDGGDKERAATQRILQRYGITQEYYFAPPDGESTVAADIRKSDAPTR